MSNSIYWYTRWARNWNYSVYFTTAFLFMSVPGCCMKEILATWVTWECYRIMHVFMLLIVEFIGKPFLADITIVKKWSCMDGHVRFQTPFIGISLGAEIAWKAHAKVFILMVLIVRICHKTLFALITPMFKAALMSLHVTVIAIWSPEWFLALVAKVLLGVEDLKDLSRMVVWNFNWLGEHTCWTIQIQPTSLKWDKSDVNCKVLNS